MLHSGEGESDRYIITYADLITLLLGLFILLYSSSNVDLQKYRKVIEAASNVFGKVDTSKVISPSKNPSVSLPGGGQAASNVQVDPFSDLREKLGKIIADEKLAQSIKLEQNDRGFTIRILDDILFLSGRGDLTEYSKIILKKVATVLKSLPNDIRIEGHTDNLPMNGGAFPSNWHLSVARATNTAFFLMNDQGLDPGRVSVVGYAEYHPISSNATPEGRANNRRVDIVILNKN